MRKEYQPLIIAVIGFIFFVFVYFNLMLQPVNKEIAEKTRILDEKSKKLQEAIILAESLPLLKQETQFLQVRIADLEKKLPTTTNIPELLRILSKQSQYYNIKISNIYTKEIDSSAQEYNEIPFSINFTTSYHNLAKFLTSIAQADRIFSAKDLIISYSGSSKEQKDNYLSGSCTLFSYTLKTK
ncbi:MAG: type 4a pilus biogenesis protein PilO [Endomicrobia bacterium]|nr:type 4a pilus biogenesis protein PilO [Endomicrobiia bacterium]